MTGGQWRSDKLSEQASGFRDLLWAGWCSQGRAYVQGNAALAYRTFEVHSRAFWALIEKTLIDTDGDVPAPDLVEEIAVEIERQCREGFDDVAAYHADLEVPDARTAA